MKKSVILLAAAILVISCDVPVGGNKRVLKKTDGVVAYYAQDAPHGTYKPSTDTVKAVHMVADTTKSAVAPEVKPATAEEPKMDHH